MRIGGFLRFDEPGLWWLEHDGQTILSVEPDGGQPRDEDRAGALLLPGVIDNHCHILPTGLDFLKLNLGACNTKEQVCDAVRDYERRLEPGKWCLAVHYEQSRFADGTHLTKKDLDGISATRPILLRHVNGHASVANSAALAAAGVTKATPDPAGGSYVRDEHGELTGVLLETAHEFVTAQVPNPTIDEMVEAILAAAYSMHGLGIMAATDMMTGRFDLANELTAYRLASERGCPIRLRLFLQWSRVFGPRAMDAGELAEHQASMDPRLCRCEGIKIFADGAIGSRTAGIYGSYEGDPAAETSGQLIYAPSRLNDMVRTADQRGWRVAVHSIGDHSTDCVMDAFETTADPSRHRLEHAMILSDAQIARLAQLGSHVTMQPEFLLRFGSAYQRQLGPERAAMLKRMRSLKDGGIPLSLSSDRPIVSGDPLATIRAAVRRPDGFEPSEGLKLEEALHGITDLAAEGNGDANTMGKLAPGHAAAFWSPVGLDEFGHN